MTMTTGPGCGGPDNDNGRTTYSIVTEPNTPHLTMTGFAVCFFELLGIIPV